jgi:hypothetical protein
LTPDAWREVIEEVRGRAGYADAPMVAIRHTDRNHDHVHIVFGVTRYDGTAVSDRFEKKKLKRIVQEVSARHGLEPVRSEKNRPYPKEHWRNVHGDRLLEAVKAAWAEPTPRAFQDHLIKAGVEPAYHIRRSDGFLQGLKFRYQGRWVKARALGKQFAAAGFRKDFRIGPQDLQGMLSQNQKLGERHDPVVLKVSGIEARELPREMAYRVSVDSIEAVPELPYTSKTPPVRLPCDFNAYAKRLSRPSLDSTFVDRLEAVKDREPTWLSAHIAQGLQPDIQEDPLGQKACRIMGHFLLRQPERNPALILDLAKNSQDPRFDPLLEKIRSSFEPARFLGSFQEDPQRYEGLMTSIAKLQSEIVERQISRASICADDLRRWEQRILAAGRARYVRAYPGKTLRQWRQELISGQRDDFARYLRAYRHRWERRLHDAGPHLGALLRDLESQPSGGNRPADLVGAGHVEQLRIFLGRHHPRALAHPLRLPATRESRVREWRPKPNTPLRALRRMRSPVRGLLSTVARHLAIPYVGLVLLAPTLTLRALKTLARSLKIPSTRWIFLPPELVLGQIRRNLFRAVELGLDLDKKQKTILRLAQGRVLSTAILHRDVLTR